MRQLVQAIDSHMELVDMEVTSNLCVDDQAGEDTYVQPLSIAQTAEDAAQLPPIGPSALLFEF